ncbi:DB module domain-containing protein [Ditylenchus destructor]|uniref:DB module domain-containing protein n=1 Tax=Ditylenchus destructor TaxID=166010 RepID=A0AAD4R0X7_9BILA|nr:DB module domain-containing protein [Ditylenchus destructor]
MIALKLSAFFLFLTVITADDPKPDPKDAPYRECCVKRGVHEKFLDPSCTYTGVRAGKNPPLDKDLLADLPAIIECSADGKDNTECCKKAKVPENCLGACNGSPPIDLLKFGLCRKESKDEHKKVLECYYENAYNK